MSAFQNTMSDSDAHGRLTNGSNVVLLVDDKRFAGTTATIERFNRTTQRFVVRTESARLIQVKESNIVDAFAYVIGCIEDLTKHPARLYARAAVRCPRGHLVLFWGQKAQDVLVKRRDAILAEQSGSQRVWGAPREIIASALGFSTTLTLSNVQFSQEEYVPNHDEKEWLLSLYKLLSKEQINKLMRSVEDTFDHSFAAAVLYQFMYPDVQIVMGRLMVGKLLDGRADIVFDHNKCWHPPPQLPGSYRFFHRIEPGQRVVLKNRPFSRFADLVGTVLAVIDPPWEQVVIGFRRIFDGMSSLETLVVPHSDVTTAEIGCRTSSTVVTAACHVAKGTRDLLYAMEKYHDPEGPLNKWRVFCTDSVNNVTRMLDSGMHCAVGCCFSVQPALQFRLDCEKYFLETQGLLRSIRTGVDKREQIIRSLTLRCGDDKPSCPICYEEVVADELRITKCGHVFCEACFKKLEELHVESFTMPCPVCRTNLYSTALL